MDANAIMTSYFFVPYFSIFKIETCDRLGTPKAMARLAAACRLVNPAALRISERAVMVDSVTQSYQICNRFGNTFYYCGR